MYLLISLYSFFYNSWCQKVLQILFDLYLRLNTVMYGASNGKVVQNFWMIFRWSVSMKWLKKLVEDSIHFQHPDDRQHIPSRIRNQLQLMGTNPRVDGPGHLLASSSVGEMERSFYYAPQVARLNRTRDGQTPQRVQFDRTIREFSRDNLELAMLIGIWLSFMICHHQVYVRSVLVYPKKLSMTMVCPMPSNEMCFGNIQNGECFYEL